MNASPLLRIGCSGWQYRHWRGSFYPADLPVANWLARYARTFDTVELNNSFYRLPSAAAFRRWRDQTPPGFLFAVKASRYLTHMKKLKDPGEPLARFFEAAGELGPKLGPVLYQLSPRWAANIERLRAFVAALPRGVSHVMEFRDPSWYAPEILNVLERAGVALCLHDMTGSATVRRRVGPFAYVRFHGTTRRGGRYDDAALESWAEWMESELRRGAPVFAYFNNDVGGHAPRDAARLAARLRRDAVSRPAPPDRAGAGRRARGTPPLPPSAAPSRAR
ncbi:MAG TPA: DUF72 domain-containing protein [Vicinamibacterales bacterium]|nr:DUF72 domain-containing protein [Vicinamibacterales bacterium]